MSLAISHFGTTLGIGNNSFFELGYAALKDATQLKLSFHGQCVEHESELAVEPAYLPEVFGLVECALYQDLLALVGDHCIAPLRSVERSSKVFSRMVFHCVGMVSHSSL